MQKTLSVENPHSLKDTLRTPKSRVALISLTHGVNDVYAGFLATFLPFIKENLGLSYSLAGSFNVIVGFFHIVCQPVIGYLCDRIRRPVLMAVGPILCGLGAVMLPNTASYAMAVLFAGVWGLGSALYHSQGGGGIGYVAALDRLTRALTWYNIAGTAGTMLSPILAVWTVKTWGYKGLFVTLVPAVLTAPLLCFSMPFLRDGTARNEKKGRGLFGTLGAIFAVLYPIWAVALIRDLLFQCARFFLPMKIAEEGGDLRSVGTVVFCVTLSGTLGMPPMAAFARKWGERKAYCWSLVSGLAVFLAAAVTAGWLSVTLYLLGVGLVYSTLPLTISIAQRLVPDERSAASSIVSGLAWGVSNVLMAPCGKIADVIGVEAALFLTGLLPLFCLPFLMTRAFDAPLFSSSSSSSS
ncbi:MAG: MFS transporter [Synergistaceae bacterium]|jgi:FSR family fosmidomycin resistance protein-like MFS transporter|nr:MFS transporter [Synergistaceae bacterium]